MTAAATMASPGIESLADVFCRFSQQFVQLSLAMTLVAPVEQQRFSGTVIMGDPVDSADAVVETIADGVMDYHQAKLAVYTHLSLYHTVPGYQHMLEIASAPGMECMVVTAPDFVSGAERDNLAQQLRDVSGLPINMIADIIGVSRMSYHKWVNGMGVRESNERQLLNLVQLFRKLRGLPIVNMRAFLELETPEGRPLDLLKASQFAAVVKIAVQMVAHEQDLRESVAQEGPRFPKLMKRVVSGDVPHRAEVKHTYRPLQTPHLTEEQMIALGVPASSAPRYRRGRG